jgi:hypothetical protein
MFDVVMTGECDIWLVEDMGPGLSSVIAGGEDEVGEDVGRWSWKEWRIGTRPV